jgi:hypothetical protein
VGIRYLSWSPHDSVITLPRGKELKIPRYALTSDIDFVLAPGESPAPKILHVAPIDSRTFDAVYAFSETDIVLFQAADKPDVSEKSLEAVLACYTTEAHEASLEEFTLVFVVLNEQQKDEYVTKYIDGHDVKIGGELQHIAVGVLVIDLDDIRTLEVSGVLSRILTIRT